MTIPSIKEIQEELECFLSNDTQIIQNEAKKLLNFFSSLKNKRVSEESIREMASSLSFECKNPRTEYNTQFSSHLSFAKVLYHSFLTLIYRYPLNDMRRGAFLDPNLGKSIPEEYLVILFDQYHWDARHLYAWVKHLGDEKYESFTAKELHWIEKIALREFTVSCRSLNSTNKQELLTGLDFLSQQSDVIKKSKVEEAIPAVAMLLNDELCIAEQAVIALANLHRHSTRMMMDVEVLFPFLASNNAKVIASVYELLAKYTNENQPSPPIFQLAGGVPQFIWLLTHSNEHAVLFSLNMLVELAKRNHTYRNQIGVQCPHMLLPLLDDENEEVVIRATSLLWYLSLDNASCTAFYKAGAVFTLMKLLSNSTEEVVEFALRTLINFLGAVHGFCVEDIHNSKKINKLLLLLKHDNAELMVLSIRIIEHMVYAKYYHEMLTSNENLSVFLSFLDHSESCIEISALNILKYLAQLYPHCRVSILNQGGLNNAVKLLSHNDEELVTSALCLIASLAPHDQENQRLLCDSQVLLCFISILEDYTNTVISINDRRYNALMFILKDVIKTFSISVELTFLHEIEFYAILSKLIDKAEKPFLRSSLRWRLFNETEINVSHYNLALYSLLLAHQQFLSSGDHEALQHQILAVIEQIKPFVKKPVLRSEASFYNLLERTEQLLSSENATVITL